MRISCVLLVAVLCPVVLLGQNQVGVEELRASIVKITSKAPEGQPRTGTGFIVHVEGELIYIATASHVVEGDQKPQVAFYHDRRRPVAAEIGVLEDNPIAGLGYLIVRDRAVAEKVKALRWGTERLKGGEDILTIGFGQGLEWGVIKGTVASVSGSDVMIDGRIEEGNSGGPILMNGSVAGMVTSVKQGLGVGKSGIVVQSTLRGWDIELSTPTTEAQPKTPRADVDPMRPSAGRPDPPPLGAVEGAPVDTPDFGTVLLYDDFRDNRNRWPVASDTHRRFNVSEGRYTMSSATADGYTSSLPIEINETSDFQIRCRVTRRSGVSNFFFGLIWGKRDEDNFFHFAITGQGNVAVARKRDGRFFDYIDPALINRHVRRDDSTNLLVLRKEGKQIRFYVNGYQVHDMSAEPFFANGVGFEIYNNLEIDFDDLVVTTR